MTVQEKTIYDNAINENIRQGKTIQYNTRQVNQILDNTIQYDST